MRGAGETHPATLKRLAALSAALLVTSCARPTVASGPEEALYIARASLADTEGRPAIVERHGAYWEITFDVRPGDPAPAYPAVQVKAVGARGGTTYFDGTR